jgi:hypothetical protein
MKTLLASALLTAIILVGEMLAASPRPDAQPGANLVVAQRFCPNGRC